MDASWLTWQQALSAAIRSCPRFLLRAFKFRKPRPFVGEFPKDGVSRAHDEHIISSGCARMATGGYAPGDTQHP